MLLQVQRVSTVISRTETRWENAIENRKRNSNAGSGLGSKNQLCGKRNGRTWSSRHRKCFETAIKRYTMCSNVLRDMEQKDSLI